MHSINAVSESRQLIRIPKDSFKFNPMKSWDETPVEEVVYTLKKKREKQAKLLKVNVFLRVYSA